MVADLVAQHAGGELQSENWDLETLYEEADQPLDIRDMVRPQDLAGKSPDEIIDHIATTAEERYNQKETEFEDLGSISATPSARSPSADRRQVGGTPSTRWTTCARGSTSAATPSRIRSSLQEGSYEMFQTLLKSIQDDMVNWMFHLVVQPVRPQPVRRRLHPRQRGRRS